MHIDITIPEPFAGTIATLAASQGITPEQWVVRTIRAAIAPKETKRLGRPRTNDTRDAEIRAKLAAGASAQGIAKEYGIHTARVYQIGKAV